MKRRIVYYSDEQNDDFAGGEIRRRRIGADFPFVHRSPLWRAAAFVLYYFLALPAVFVINKLWYGMRIRNRRALRGLRDGFFLYGNHTQRFADVTCPSLLAFPKKAYVVAGAEAASIRGIAWLVQMLGGLVLPTEFSGMRGFALHGEEYRRPKGDLGKILNPWYNRKYLDFGTRRDHDALLYSSELVGQLARDYEKLMPLCRFMSAAVRTAEQKSGS